MSAKDERQNVVAYLQGELGPVETVRFERALAESAEVRAELEAARETLGFVVEAAPADQPPRQLRQRVFERVAVEPQVKRVRPSLKEVARDVGPRRRTRVALFALAAAASVALALVLGWHVPDEGAEERLPLATVRWSYGDVDVSEIDTDGEASTPWRVERDEDTGEAPTLFAGQRIETQRRSYAECELGERARILLDERTTLSVLAAQTPDEADWLWLERGLAHFDVTAPPDAEGTPHTRGQRPFVVFTRHGEVRVRGTRFLVRSTDDVTVVAVLNGRVDAFATPRHGEARPMEPVRTGHFAALGTRDALRRSLPSGMDLSALDEAPQAHDEEAGPTGAPPADSTHPVIFTSSLIAVEFEVDTPRVNVEGSGPVWASITLRNQSPFSLRLLDTGEDNLMLHHRGTAPDADPWSPVRPLRLTLEAGGEPHHIRVALPTVLYEHGTGPYYVSAVYTGLIELEAGPRRSPDEADTATWPVARNGEPYNRTAVFESRSKPASVIYSREAAEDENDEVESDGERGE